MICDQCKDCMRYNKYWPKECEWAPSSAKHVGNTKDFVKGECPHFNMRMKYDNFIELQACTGSIRIRKSSIIAVWRQSNRTHVQVATEEFIVDQSISTIMYSLEEKV